MSRRYGCTECGTAFPALDDLAEHDHGTHGEPARYVVDDDAVAKAITAERARVRDAVEHMPTARIISQWDLVSRRAVIALLDDPS